VVDYIYLDRILFPVTALGPGNRVAIWVAGCSRKCPLCANPELWQKHEEQKINAEKLASQVNSLQIKGIDGITLTGGEPFDQAEGLTCFIDKLKFKTEILAFSGYKIEELKNDAVSSRLLSIIDVLVDGEYINEMNDGKAVLRGSTNQVIHYLNPKTHEKYSKYLSEGRKIQNFVYEYNTLSVGIHNP
jgi:anaerobic ribonucleoside-triphosphate reductase-activating protein